MAAVRWLLLRPRLILRAVTKIARGVANRFISSRRSTRISADALDFTVLGRPETDRLLLQPLTLADLDKLVCHFPSGQVGQKFPGNVPAPRWWDELALVSDVMNDSFTWAVYRRSDLAAVGVCALGLYVVDNRREVELGYWIGERFRGNGCAVESARAVLEAACRQMKIRRVISLIAPTNHSSIRVAERNGMTLEKETRFRGGLMLVYTHGEPVG